MRPTLSSSSHVDERDRNPDAIARAFTPAARLHSRLTRAEKSKHSNHLYTERWTEKQPWNHRSSTDDCPAPKPRGVSLSVEVKGAGRTTVFKLNTPEFVRFRCTLWYFPQGVLKTSLDRILFGVGRYLFHIPPGARALVRRNLLKTTKHGFIHYFNGKTLINHPKSRVRAALQSCQAFIV